MMISPSKIAAAASMVFGLATDIALELFI